MDACEILSSRSATADDGPLVDEIKRMFNDALDRELRRSHDGSLAYHQDLRMHTDHLLRLLRRTYFEMVGDRKDKVRDIKEGESRLGQVAKTDSCDTEG